MNPSKPRQDPHAPLGACATLEEFEALVPEWERAQAALELSAACGAMLMLERAFGSHPAARALEACTDHEGGYFLHVHIQHPSGETVRANDLLLALYAMAESEEGEKPSPYADPALAAEFPGLAVEAVSEMESAFQDAMNFFCWRARRPFFDALPIDRLSASDAPGLARQLGLFEAAALLEQARVERACGPGGAARPATRI